MPRRAAKAVRGRTTARETAKKTVPGRRTRAAALPDKPLQHTVRTADGYRKLGGGVRTPGRPAEPKPSSAAAAKEHTDTVTSPQKRKPGRPRKHVQQHKQPLAEASPAAGAGPSAVPEPKRRRGRPPKHRQAEQTQPAASASQLGLPAFRHESAQVRTPKAPAAEPSGEAQDDVAASKRRRRQTLKRGAEDQAGQPAGEEQTDEKAPKRARGAPPRCVHVPAATRTAFRRLSEGRLRRSTARAAEQAAGVAISDAPIRQSKRGRPQVMRQATEQAEALTTVAQHDAAVAKRRRGRPPKSLAAAQAAGAELNIALLARRKRGRPPMSQATRQAARTAGSDEPVLARKRGRPPKSQSAVQPLSSTGKGASLLPRKRGRPVKSAPSARHEPSPQPAGGVLNDTSLPKRNRGRPRKSQAAEQAGPPAGEVQPVSEMAEGKRSLRSKGLRVSPLKRRPRRSPRAPPPSGTAAAKRTPRRPPKRRVQEKPAGERAGEAQATAPVVKHKRGRPPKHKLAEQADVPAGTAYEAGRKAGRIPKRQLAVQAAEPPTTANTQQPALPPAAKRPRGRPRKRTLSTAGAPSEDAALAHPAPHGSEQAAKKPRTAASVDVAGVPVAKRPRGRPRKQAAAPKPGASTGQAPASTLTATAAAALGVVMRASKRKAAKPRKYAAFHLLRAVLPEAPLRKSKRLGF